MTNIKNIIRQLNYQRWLFLFLVFHFSFLINAQSTDQNWVKTKTYKQATTTPIATPTVSQANTQVSYFDGLGRPIQQVAHQQSNSGKDIVTHIEYDAFGRPEKEFLPYVNSASSLNFNTSANSDVLSYYNTPAYENTANPYSQKQFEASPLNRVLKQSAPGNAWNMGSGNEIKLDYQTNTTNEVKLFQATTTWDATNSVYNIALVNGSFYGAGELYKNITKDENWKPANGFLNTIEEFKNKTGQVVLKRTYNLVNGTTEAHDTFYVYDIYGNLTYVIPPAVSGTVDQTKLDNLCYQYKYDHRNRLVEKKLPGKQWEYLVYDKLDRVVAIGPAYNPYGGSDSSKGWMITKYDALGRIVYTGYYNTTTANSTANRTTLQGLYNGSTIISEAKSASNVTINNIATRYTNNAFPTGITLLTVNYYDDYDFPNAPTLPTTIEGQTVATNTQVRTLPTGSWNRILDTAASTTGELSYTVYDDRYRPIRTYLANYLGGYTQIDTNLDWAGKTLYTITKHKRNSAATELITKDSFEYSPQDRLLKHKHQINTLPEQLLTLNTYDELGQLTSKKIGGQDTTGTTSLQKVDYSYNIRGWLKSINDINDLNPTVENDLFAFKINYNDYNAIGTNDTAPKALFNGNISSTYWKTSTDNTVRKYNYQYDELNRLLEANYNRPEQTNILDHYREKLTYDKNGNITSLLRNGNNDPVGGSATPVNTIDDLVYTYDTNNQNQLLKVKDNSPSTHGFKDVDVAGTNDYTYDLNGNMVTDLNKNITNIEYNHLNLPTKITFGTTGNITYIYNATGQKVKKTVTQGTTITNDDYLSGYQYRNNVLLFFPHAEGYVNFAVVQYSCPTCRFIKPSPTYNYVFNYTDHLGNIRLSYSKDPSSGELTTLEENHYYAFGLKHTNYNTDVNMLVSSSSKLKFNPTPSTVKNYYQYKYNEREWQDELGLNMTDMDYRQYDNALGRFVSMDVLSEFSFNMTPYHFSYNDPISYSDPTGLCPECSANVKDPKNGSSYTVNGINYIYDGKTWVGQVEEVVVTGGGKKSSSSSNASFNLPYFSNTLSMYGVPMGTFLEPFIVPLAEGALGLVATDVAIPDPTDLAPPKWIGYAVIVVVAGSIVIYDQMSDDGDSSTDGDNEDVSSSRTGNGRGSNNRTADDEAVGDHTVRDENGHTTYKENPNNPNKNSKGKGFETDERVDYRGRSHKDKQGNDVPTPHVHKGKTIRPAVPGRDMPRRY